MYSPLPKGTPAWCLDGTEIWDAMITGYDPQEMEEYSVLLTTGREARFDVNGVFAKPAGRDSLIKALKYEIETAERSISFLEKEVA